MSPVRNACMVTKIGNKMLVQNTHNMNHLPSCGCKSQIPVVSKFLLADQISKLEVRAKTLISCQKDLLYIRQYAIFELSFTLVSKQVLTIVRSLPYQISFIHKQILVHLHVHKTSFHLKDFSLGLALKQRQKISRKSPIFSRAHSSIQKSDQVAMLSFLKTAL